MKLFRSFSVSFAGFISATCIFLLIWLLALQTSIFNQAAVKQGVSDANVYSTFIPELSKTIQTQASGQTTNILTSDALATALNNTFNSTYIKTQTESIIDSSYSWINGSASEISFSIPVNENRETLIQELAKVIEPTVNELPVCTALNQASTKSIICRPSNKTNAEFATNLAEQAIDSSNITSAPITSASFSPNTNNSFLSQLPFYYQATKWLSIILAVVAVVFFGIMLFASTEKFRSLANFGRKLFFGSLIPLCFGGAMFWLGSQSNGLPGLDQSTITMADVVVPLMQKLLQLIGSQLLIFSGAVLIISLAMWIGFKVVHKNKTVTKLKSAIKQQPITKEPTEPPKPPQATS